MKYPEESEIHSLVFRLCKVHNISTARNIRHWEFFMPHYNDSSRGGDRSRSHPGAGNRKKKTSTAKPSGRGVSIAKAEDSQQSDDQIVQPELSRVPLQLNQKLLNLFAASFPNLLDASAASPTSKLSTLLAQVKRHLYERDFTAAFGPEENLAAYAARWSPSRALGYISIFDEVFTYLGPGVSGPSNTISAEEEVDQVVCLGGGAGAELVALAGMHSLRTLSNTPLSEDTDDERDRTLNLSVISFDRATWAPVHELLHRAIITPPTLSKYASASARSTNCALISPATAFKAACHQLDLLSPELSLRCELQEAIEKSSLITLMFTLNELYSVSLPQTQALLQDITTWSTKKKGTLLLVVDSPGSYSEIGIGPQKKTYPMRWMLDLALLGPADKRDEESASWVQLISEDSRWFRLPPSGQLKYPIELENMRFQMHLYRRQ